ncbi:MAG: GAF domain-containing protein [Chloroflexota bacterium]
MSRQGSEKKLETLQKAYDRLQEEYLHLSERTVALHVLQEMTLKLTSDLNLQTLLKNILDSAIKVVGAVAGSLLLLDKRTDELVFAVVVGGGGENLRGRSMPRNKGIAGWVMNSRQPLIVDDVSQDPRFYEGFESSRFHTANIICIPLIARGDIIGVLQVLNKSSGERFNQDDLNLLMTFAAQSATAIENAQLVQALREERDRIVALEEDVRKRLARDLHDGPTQLLAAIRMGLEFSRKMLAHDATKVDKELSELLPIADRALKQVRTLLFDLRPAVLETQGLVPALEYYTRQIQDTEGLWVHLETGGFDGRLAGRVEKEIFSVIQEALGNAKKHARAQNVWVGLALQDDCLVAFVRDDGEGFDTRQLNPNRGREGSLGMINMHERAQMVGGELTIDSVPGQGTTITLAVPLAGHRLETN